MAQKVILDVDTGADDAAAILLAGHHPALELAAVTVAHGNAPLSTTLENTLRTMSAGALEHVPVYSGAALPLVHPMISSSPTQEAVLPLAETSLKPQPQHAVQFLIDYYMSAAGPETIYLPVGPHTNLALALRIEPESPREVVDGRPVVYVLEDYGLSNALILDKACRDAGLPSPLVPLAGDPTGRKRAYVALSRRSSNNALIPEQIGRASCRERV